MTQAALNTIGLAILGAMLSLMGGLFLYIIKRRDEGRDRQQEQIADLQLQLAVMQEKVTPISAAMLAVWVKELTHDHAPELDALLAKLQPYSLTHKELRRLKVLLEERTRDMGPKITESERLAAEMVPILIKKLQVEADLPVEEMDVVMVGIPKDTPK